MFSDLSLGNFAFVPLTFPVQIQTDYFDLFPTCLRRLLHSTKIAKARKLVRLSDLR